MSNYDIIYNNYKTLKYEFNLQTVFRICLQTSRVGIGMTFLFINKRFFSPERKLFYKRIYSVYTYTGRWSCADRTALINKDDDDSHFRIFRKGLYFGRLLRNNWNQLFLLNGRIKIWKLFHSVCELMTYELCCNNIRKRFLGSGRHGKPV